MLDGIASEVAALGRVLAVWAHPDDETYLCGGLLAVATDGGQHVTVVTATYGELGFNDPCAWPAERAAAVRRWEAAAALAVLGVADHRWLEIPDGACAAIDVDAGAAMIRRAIADVRPDTVLTFGPDGVTGHPDHRALSAWVAAATDGGDQCVLHAAVEASFAARFRDVEDRLDVYMEPGLPVTVSARELAVHLRLDGALLDRKLAALRALATQTRPVIDILGDDLYASWVAEECFVVGRS
jgi:LmbE family N-acetylglucosaminyl deacetylase